MEPPISAIVSVLILFGGWVISVERRIWGLRDLNRTVRRIDKRTFQMLIRADPHAAASELQETDLDND